MNIVIIPFSRENIDDVNRIWNDVVSEGNAFPQVSLLDVENGIEFFESQSFTGVALDEESGKVVGIYILHPNNVGRCGHICNASYAVDKSMRGKHIGEKLVSHCMKKGAELGFKILQFNAVVASNKSALKLYEHLGFTKLGTIPNGFLTKDGSFEDIIPHYIEL